LKEIKEQLRREYPYLIETHAHTSPASPCSEIKPESAVRTYHRLGYHGLAITNHFNLLIMPKKREKEKILRAYMQDFEQAREEGERLGMRIYFGVEIRFSENANDYLVYGVDESFLGEAYETLDLGIEAFYERCKSERNLIVQAHPFRDKLVRADPRYLDGIEVFNMHPHHNSRVGLAERYARERGMLMTAGTDYHHPGHEGLAGIRLKTLPQDTFELADRLRSRDFLLQLGGMLVLP